MRISVYITSYNQKHHLIEAIDSVLNQTLRPFQIIIVDDCSLDGSQELIAAYASRNSQLITPIYHTYNQGVAQTRIDALEAVTGDYVSRVDGDDRFLPTKLEKEAKLLRENPTADIAFSNHYYMTEKGAHTGVWVGRKKPPQGDVFRQTFARDFPRNSLFKDDLVNYAAWRRIGSYDPNLLMYEDYDMCIRLTKHLRVVYHDEPLSERRVHHAGLSSAEPTEHLAAVEYLFRKNRPLLDDLPLADRRKVERALAGWKAKMAAQAAYEEIRDEPDIRGGRAKIVRCYIECLRHNPRYLLDYTLLLRTLLPLTLYERLRALSHTGRRRTR